MLCFLLIIMLACTFLTSGYILQQYVPSQILSALSFCTSFAPYSTCLGIIDGIKEHIYDRVTVRYQIYFGIILLLLQIFVSFSILFYSICTYFTNKADTIYMSLPQQPHETFITCRHPISLSAEKYLT